MYNKSIIIGNLARDPESRKVGDTSVTRLVVAVQDQYKKDKTSFIDVDAWGKLGDICSKYLEKGRQVLVEGRLIQDSWEKDGEKRSKLFINADEVKFLGNKGSNATNVSSGGSSAGKASGESFVDEDVPF